MHVPLLIQNNPEALKEFELVKTEIGPDADPALAYSLAFYALLRADVRTLQDEVNAEGTTFVRATGSTYANPKVRMLATSRKQLLAITRQLGLVAKAGEGPRRPQRQSLRERLNGTSDPLI